MRKKRSRSQHPYYLLPYYAKCIKILEHNARINLREVSNRTSMTSTTQFSEKCIVPQLQNSYEVCRESHSLSHYIQRFADYKLIHRPERATLKPLSERPRSTLWIILFSTSHKNALEQSIPTQLDVVSIVRIEVVMNILILLTLRQPQ